MTQEELAQRRERARQKHTEMLSARKKDEVDSAPTSTEPEAIIQNTSTTVDGQTEISQTDGTSELCNENANPSEPPDQFLAFARVYSGVIKKGEKLFVLGPKHEPCTEDVVNVEDVSEQMYSQ